MLNSLWNILIYHTEMQDAHVTVHESLGLVCSFTKPEKEIMLQTEKVCGEVTVSFQQLFPIVNSCQHPPQTNFMDMERKKLKSIYTSPGITALQTPGSTLLPASHFPTPLLPEGCVTSGQCPLSAKQSPPGIPGGFLAIPATGTTLSSSLETKFPFLPLAGE